MGVQTHELNTDPEAFDAVVEGRKNFEIRYDDRGYQVGDQLILLKTRYTAEEMKRGYSLEYTDRAYGMRVSYITRGPCCGLAEGWVIMSIEV